MATMVLAAPANADPNDAQFLKNIRDNLGSEITDSQALIDSAHDICSQLQQGKSYDQVLMGVRQGNQYWNYDESAYFVSASAQAYCPDRVSTE